MRRTNATLFVGALLLSAASTGVGCSLLTSFDGVVLGDGGARDGAATSDQASDQAVDVDAAICFAGRYYCGTQTGGTPSDLYQCTADGGAFVQMRTCSHACVERDSGDVCGCVVGGLYCGYDQVLGMDPNSLYTCGANYEPVPNKVCPNGCRINVGSDDTCN